MAVRAADAVWISRAHWEQVSPEDRERFAPICPNSVGELRSPSYRLSTVQDELAEFLANGARVGWLLDPRPRHVYVYRPGVPVERLEGPETVSSDPFLPGFILDLRDVW